MAKSQDLEYAEIRYIPPKKDTDHDAYIVGRALYPNFRQEYVLGALPRGKGKDGIERYEYRTGLRKEDYLEEDKKWFEENKSFVERSVKKMEEVYGDESTSPYSEMWRDVNLVLDKELISLNLSDPKDLRIYFCIKGGGFPVIASNPTKAQDSAVPYRFMLVEPLQDIQLKTTPKKTKYEAIAALMDLNTKHSFDDLLIVYKNLIPADSAATKNTPKDILFTQLGEFIEGEIVKSSRGNNIREFMKVIDDLKNNRNKVSIGAYLKDAIYYDYVVVEKATNRFKNKETNTILGSTMEDAISFLTSPANEDELKSIVDRINVKWNAK
jgi:hypothetical protein